jgi:hypothetical protein
MGSAKAKNLKNNSLVEIISALVLELNEKEKRVITGRFGFTGRKETLSAIGKELHLSRERVRQIEKNSIKKLSAAFSKNHKEKIESIVKTFGDVGGVVNDEKISSELISLTGNHKFSKSYLRLAFSIMNDIEKIDENSDLLDGWRLSTISKDKIVSVCTKIIEHFKEQDIPLSVEDLKKDVADLTNLDLTFISACVCISTKLVIAKNGMVGLRSWPSVNPRNVRDKIYYVLKTAGSPLHFTEITSSISSLKFDNKRVVRATVHNELIADNRFVLIGRGIYALREWGFNDGTVYDVIKNILSTSKKPVPINDIITLVNKSRKVKKNTIVINLQTKKEFKKVEGGFIYTGL